MKRNLDLIRHILLKIEEADSMTTVHTFVTVEFNEFEISHHIHLLLDTNYIDATKVSRVGMKFDDFKIKRLTAFGYEYLDSVRDESTWLSIKAKLKDNLASATFDIIKDISKTILFARIGL